MNVQSLDSRPAALAMVSALAENKIPLHSVKNVFELVVQELQGQLVQGRGLSRIG